MENNCPYCGRKYQTINVHGHEQCVHCGTNLEPCCEGENNGNKDK